MLGNNTQNSAQKLNKAALHFIGYAKNEDQRLYENWYSVDTILYLTNIDERKEDFIRYVFSDDINSFGAQLKQLDKLKENLGKSACFIVKEPGAEQDHYMFGVFIKNNLLIINPVGNIRRHYFYEILGQVAEELNIYISNTIIQKYEEGLVSCGPICVEFMRHISALPLAEASKFSLQAAEHRVWEGQHNHSLWYRSIDISATKLMPKTLEGLLSKDGKEYIEEMTAIRQQHLNILQNHLRLQNLTIEKQNNSFGEIYNNSPEQTLMTRLVYEKRKIEDLKDTAEYRILENQRKNQDKEKHTEDDRKLAHQLQEEEYSLAGRQIASNISQAHKSRNKKQSKDSVLKKQLDAPKIAQGPLSRKNSSMVRYHNNDQHKQNDYILKFEEIIQQIKNIESYKEQHIAKQAKNGLIVEALYKISWRVSEIPPSAKFFKKSISCVIPERIWLLLDYLANSLNIIQGKEKHIITNIIKGLKQLKGNLEIAINNIKGCVAKNKD